ncbi:MAG TPA: hypothetical protein VGC77_15435 [Rhodopseudomonas sp.]|uniref:hypothetical protein n=1 Tax=Rhodopseudomonas sp. TaxID=1078 RepID=UPI002ED7F267
MLVLDFLLDIIGYTTARMLLPVLTFGRIRVEAVESRDIGFNGLGFKRLPDGVLLCASDLAGWIGVLIWALLLVVIALAI